MKRQRDGNEPSDGAENDREKLRAEVISPAVVEQNMDDLAVCGIGEQTIFLTERPLDAIRYLPTGHCSNPNQWKIDPIPAEIVGAAYCEVLLANLLHVKDLPWVGQLLQIFKAKEGLGVWCNTDTKPLRQATVEQSRTTYLAAVKTLKGSVLQDIQGGDEGRWYIPVFLVPKPDGTNTPKARLVANCRSANEVFSRPPHIPFATIDDLFHIFGYFGPTGHFATADFRHWFYQLSLPPWTRRFFSIQCGNFRAQFTAFPMGFSWSPFVAQGISMAFAFMAAHNAGYYLHSPRDSDVIPPYWILTNDRSKPSRSNVVGFIVFWYDNLLLVCSSAEVRSDCQDSLVKGAKRYRLSWKLSGNTTLKDYGHGEDAFQLSVGSCTYLGIDVSVQGKGVRWVHAAKNFYRWTALGDTVWQKGHRKTWRDIAAICGIIIWHWNLTGDEREALKNIFPILQRIGRECPDRVDYGKQAKISEPMIEQLKLQFSIVLDVSYARPHKFREEIGPHDRVEYWASDAMNSRGAWVRLKRDDFECNSWNWDDSQKARHISWKETAAAITTLEKAAEHIEPHTLVAIAVDNSSAAASLRKTCVAFDYELDRRLYSLKNLYIEKNISWVVLQIPGERQPADEPSRNAPLSEEKAIAAIEWMGRRIENMQSVWAALR